MRELPTGTVTLLFTDIEGSTRLLEELGDAYADVLAEHRRVLRDAFGRHDGVEVDTQGDAFFVAFERAHDGIAATGDAQRGLADGQVRVRMGLHTCEPQVTEEGYVGADVHRAARIMSAAHGGQVVLSQTTRDLVGEDVELIDLGEHVLKDVGTVRLYQLGDGEFPPLRSLGNTNLPAALEPVLGRKRELADLLRLVRVDGARLVTLTGPGGIGKTRLALELAAELVPDFDDGVWFVDLAPLRDVEHVVPAIAAVLGAKVELTLHLRDRRLLLVLDNFEQVVDAAAEVGALLAACPRLVVVVTSREPLRITGEREYPLRPLAEAPAIELFRQRAEATAPGFDAGYDVLAAICSRLDSLPLAIELAAARAKALSVDELRTRLERRLPTLAKGRRDAPERHRTLRSTIDWSHDLLTAEEQAAFSALAVFSGGWTLDAAETVADVDADLLDSLVAKSLVRREAERYAMLETIREYAAERLDERADAERLRRSHAGWIVGLGHAANMNIESDGEQQHAAVTAEADNVRAALDWARARGETELEIRILFALENWWVTAGPTREALVRAETLLAHAGEVSPLRRAQLLRVVGNCATILDGDPRGADLYEEALAEYRRAGDDVGAAAMLVRVAFAAQRNDDFARALALAEEARELLDGSDVPRLALQIVLLEALVAFERGDAERSFELFRETASASRRLGFVWQEAVAVESLARRLRQVGRLEEAKAEARAGLALVRQMGDREYAAFLLALIAACAAELGEGELAGRLWGAVQRLHRRQPMETWDGLRSQYEEAVLEARSHPGFDAARREGSQLELEDAVAYAVSPD